jgi:hypothetical protein
MAWLLCHRNMTLLWILLRNLLVSQATLLAENLALRQQLAVLRRSERRPHLALGSVVGEPMVGSLHHRYRRVA